MNRFKVAALAATAALTAGLATMLINPGPAAAHGALLTPGSRTYLCYVDGLASTGEIKPTNPACQNAATVGGTQPFYDWFGVLRSDGAGRTRGFIPDGALCSGGFTKYAGFDAPRSDWPLTHLTSGASHSWRYSNWAAHPGWFYLYITKDGYDPNQALTWAQMEEQPFLSVDHPPMSGPAPNGYYYWTGNLPANKTGRHVIYSVWQRSDSNETFYGCSDVVFDGGTGQVTGINNPLPSQSPGPSASSGTSPSASPSRSASPSPSPSRSTSPSPVPSSPAPSTPAPTGACTATYAVTNSWGNGFQAEVTVSNPRTTQLNGWTVKATFPNGQIVSQSWNSTYTQSGAVATFKNVSYNAAIPGGGSTTFGFLGSHTGVNNAPTLTCTSP
ncbi:chitin-binding protein [Catellatospora sp. TT07R-123]|uniref:lytic polysaccharide monooxygenase n=1 Tax=Catellatospora sp. TT07R-123 TaxID=2733863 RepID=UPI001B018470|nr:lytic polysaccharide monooxygenase [Catellatospora sp. TT07R-123]GHJ48626.1 chitin-binding protein [Catellatospora sp. TT07R-123]